MSMTMNEMRATRSCMPAPGVDPAPRHFTLRRLLGERLTVSHLPVLRRMHSDTRVMQPLGGVRSDRETVAYLENNLAHWDEHGFGIWILREADGGRIVGRAGLRHRLVNETAEVELVYALLPEYWGRGLATEAARACVTIGREWMGLPSIVALIHPDHVASRRVTEKSALVPERTVVQAGIAHLLYRTD